MFNRLLDQALFLIPVGGAPVQLGGLVRFGLQELVSEQFAKQRMIAVPGALFIQGDEEEVVGFEVTENLPAVLLTGHGYAQGGRQLI